VKHGIEPGEGCGVAPRNGPGHGCLEGPCLERDGRSGVRRRGSSPHSSSPSPDNYHPSLIFRPCACLGLDAVPVVETQRMEWVEPGKAFKVVSEPQLNVSPSWRALSSGAVGHWACVHWVAAGNNDLLPSRVGKPPRRLLHSTLQIAMYDMYFVFL
jgi:hypothetical protein